MTALLGVFAPLCRAFPANESTYLNFHIPHNLRHNASWPHISSSFGRFGLGPEGSMVLPVKMFEKNHHLCNAVDQIGAIDALKIPTDHGNPFILLVERGTCTFVKKVRNAQQLGAAAVLIADTEHNDLPPDSSSDSDDEDVLYFDSDPHPKPDDSNHTQHENQFRLPDDGSGNDVSIPSMMIAKKEYEEIKKIINSKPNATGIVVAEFAWHVPKFDNKVVMELWSSPIDQHTKEFMASNFSAIARTFDLNEMHGNTHENDSYNERMNLLRFKERPVLLDGNDLGCMANIMSPDEPCYHLCTNGGRYCHATHHHIVGKDIVTESLRRLCISKHYKSPKFYWDYIDHFSNFCSDSDYFANEKCVEDAFKHSNIDEKKIEACFDDSGHPSKDIHNSLLQDALEMQFKRGVHKSPTVMINHEQNPRTFWYGLTPRSVLAGLCETFNWGEKPHVCYACMNCGDPVACVNRSPMKCLQGDGEEKEDENAHKQDDHSGGKSHHEKSGHKVFRWFFALFLVGGCFGGYVYYKKRMAEDDGLGSYSLQDAFLSNN
jgi:hypothetical protein